jgi:hypothetical protein
MMLENEIRQLCEKVIAAADDVEAEQAASELRAALHEHIETLRGTVLLTSPLAVVDPPES